MHTLLDIAKSKNTDVAVGLIEENLRFAPEVGSMLTRVVRGTSYETFIRSGLPNVGFRDANAGVGYSKSALKRGRTELMILSAIVGVDKAVALAYEDGMAAYEMLEADGVFKAAIQSIGRQIFEGVTADAKGFTGLKSLTPKANTDVFVDATGAAAGKGSSVYLVVEGLKDVHLVFGQDSTIELSEFRDQTIPDPADASKWIDGRVAGMTGWVGLQVGNLQSCVRIGNLTDENGKGLTDRLLAEALAKFPVGVVPSKIFMSRRSRMQLQQSRTVTLRGDRTNRPDGSNATVAPTPTSFEDIPIVATDSIPDNSAIE